MAGYSNPYPPDWKQQRRIMREQERLQRAHMRAQARAEREVYRMQRHALRRGSIVGPLALITLGIVFLLVETGRLQSSYVWQWYGHWWPAILLGAGLIILGEWAFDRFLSSEERPMMHRGIGAGLWMLFFFVIVSGSLTSRVWSADGSFPNFVRWLAGQNGDSIPEFFGNRYEIDQPLDQTLPAGAAVTIVSPRGGVTLNGTSTDGQMHIQLRRAIYTNSQSDADEKARKLMPKVETFGQQVSLSLPAVDGTETDMTITVPPTTALNITTNHGGIGVGSINAAITLSSTKGDIEVDSVRGTVNARVASDSSNFQARNVTGTVMLDTSGHDITITDIAGSATVRSNAHGTAHFERITGNASYHSDRTQFYTARLDGQFDTGNNHITVDSAVGPTTLTTSSYDITLQRLGGNVTVRNSNGTIDLSSAPPLGNVLIDNQHGDVTLTLPTHASFTIEGTVRNHGEISSDFDLPAQNHDGHGASIRGTVGSGGPTLHINTDRGDIALRKSDLQPLPATAPAIHASIGAVNATPSSDGRAEVRQSIAEAKASIHEARQEIRNNAAEARREAQEARQEARHDLN